MRQDCLKFVNGDYFLNNEIKKDQINQTLAGFPSTIVEKLRYADTDRQGHINNSVFSVFFESGRVNFLYDPKNPLAEEGEQFVVAEITVRFIKELNWPNEVIVGTAVSKMGRSSLGLTQAIFCDGVCVATANSVIVLMDEVSRRSTALSDNTRTALQQLQIQL